MMELSQRELLPGIKLTALQTNKFKTSMLAFTFLEPLSAKTAAENALIPAVLRRGCQSYPDMLSMSAALDDLYGGAIEPMVRKKGETQCIGLLGSFLDDCYIPEESNILESAIELMAQLLLKPAGEPLSFVPDYLESEKQNLASRIRSRINDKQQYAVYRLTSQMCAGEAYGVDKLGEVEAVEAITQEGLWARYQALLVSSPIQLYYCGAAPIARVEAAMRAALSALPQGERTSSTATVTTQASTQEGAHYFEDHMDVLQGKLVMGFRLDASYTESSAAAALLVFNAIYGGSTNAKLFLNVRERLSLCYYANSMADKYKGILLVSSGIAFDQYEKAKDEILAQLDDCRKGHITQQELESARRFVINNLCLTADAQGRLEDFWLGQAVVGSDDPPNVLEQAAEAVTLEEIQILAQKMHLDSVYFLQGKEGETL